MLDVASAFGRIEAIHEASDRVPKFVPSSGACFAQEGLELGGRRARRLPCGREAVHYDDLAARRGWFQGLLDFGEEGRPGHRAGQNQRRHEPFVVRPHRNVVVRRWAWGTASTNRLCGVRPARRAILVSALVSSRTTKARTFAPPRQGARRGRFRPCRVELGSPARADTQNALPSRSSGSIGRGRRTKAPAPGLQHRFG